MEPTVEKYSLKPEALDNAELTADSYMRRGENIAFVYTCDARYQIADGVILAKVIDGKPIDGDMIEAAARQHLSGEGEKTIFLESGCFLFSPSLGIGFNITFFDELTFNPLSEEDIRHAAGQKSVMGAPGGVDICGLIQRGKVKKVNGIAVEELEEKYGTSWRWYVDQASKGFHLGLVSLLGTVLERNPETLLGDFDVNRLKACLAPKTMVIKPAEFEWGGREVKMQCLTGKTNRGTLNQTVFERTLAAMTCYNYLRTLKHPDLNNYWIGENPADIKHNIYNAIEHSQYL